MTNIVVQPEVIQALAECIIDVIQNKIDWESIDWQAVAEKAIERPKGEWIVVHDERYVDNVKCPFCDKEIVGTDLNFCVKCGADMRKVE